jgi:hypothetical protein
VFPGKFVVEYFGREKRGGNVGASTYRWYLIGWLVALFLVPVSGANRYVEITRSVVNIRSAPTTGSTLVVKANRGNIFFLQGEEDGWFRIRLFSGRSRFVHKNLAKIASYKPEVPADINLRRNIYEEWFRIEEKVEREADRRYSPNDNLEKNLEYKQLLEDRYKLELMQRFKVQAPVYRRIILEGNQKRWHEHERFE